MYIYPSRPDTKFEYSTICHAKNAGNFTQQELLWFNRGNYTIITNEDESGATIDEGIDKQVVLARTGIHN